jgi:murein L,D-transpeptidase YcbB/YkuD
LAHEAAVAAAVRAPARGARHRALARRARGSCRCHLRRGERGKVEPGQGYAGLSLLARRLLALGDLAAAPGAPPAVYDAPLVDAVRAFQRRHGLADDGVIGAATLARLEVPPAARARQLELALERLRWTPLLRRERMVVINIPEFVLRA